MINDAQLKSIEAEHHAHEDAENEWIVRNARRYLALRGHGVLMGMPHNLKLVSDGELDAAADRLLEGGE